MRSNRRLLGAGVIVVAMIAACGSSRDDDGDREGTLGKTTAALTVEVPASADSFLRRIARNHNSGAEPTLRLTGLGDNRALVRFSASALAALPLSGPVKLRITITDNGNNWGSSKTLDLHRLTHDWEESTCTWNCSSDSNPSNILKNCSGATEWDMDDATPWVSAPTASTTVSNGQTGAIELDVSADVTLFRSGTPNYGWVLKKRDEDAPGRVELSSREGASPPKLVATCTEAGDSGTCAAPDAGADGGGATDAGQDAASCTPETCTSPSTCASAQCVSGSCTITPLPSGTSCPTGSVCSTGACDGAGACVATPIVLPPPAPCQRVICDDVTGISMTPAADGTSCNADSSECTVGDTCQSGACVAGPARVCTPSGPCVTSTCEPSTGCTESPRPAGTSCDPAPNVCAGVLSCNGLGQCMQGAPLDCGASTVCETRGCSPISGCFTTTIPNCDPTPQSDAPYELRASLLGRLVNAGGGGISGASFTVRDAPLAGGSGAVRSDVQVTSASDGSFRLRLASFPEGASDGTPPIHVVLRVQAAGVLPVFRDAWLKSGSAIDLGRIRMVAEDSAVTTIGPAGGIARDSRNLIEVTVPAGALSTTVPIRITPFDAREDFPAPLPDSTPTLFGFELTPDGQTFAQPVTVRVANSKNVPTSLSIPTGRLDQETGLWEHIGQATWDGARFRFETSSFSTYDCNASKPRGPKPRPRPGPPPNDPRPPPDKPCLTCPCPGSDATIGGGALKQSFKLPSYKVRSEDIGLTLTYDSGLAGARRLGAAPSDYVAGDHGSFAASTTPLRIGVEATPSAVDRGTPAMQPGACAGSVSTTALGQATPIPFTVSESIAGSTWSQSFTLGAQQKEAEAQGFVNLPLASGQVASPGLYLAHTTLRAASPTACIASGGTFGATNALVTGVSAALDPGPIASFDRHVLVNHRVSSPYGAGWSIGELSRLYRNGDRAWLVDGSGSEETFRPRAYPSLAYLANSPLSVTRDPVTGEIFIARLDGKIERVDLATKTATTVLSGLPFGAGPQGFAIAYVGGARRFLLWADTQLFEVDAAGAVRVLATRGATTVWEEGHVAARGDHVVFTNALSSALFSVRLSDPARTVTTLSLPTGGDERLRPRAALSGVTFGSPRGLAFAADGTLYVADVRRNELYAIAPASGSPTADIGAASVVQGVVGNGGADLLPELGERTAGPAMTLGEPLGVAVAEDGTVFAISSYGAAAYDPLTREAEWMVYFAGVDEMLLDPAIFVSVVALTRTTLLTRHDSGTKALVKIDIDPLSSEWEPTRTIRRLPAGGHELVDTTAARISDFDPVGRVIATKKRTGEHLMDFAYADPRTDKLATVTDAEGGQTVFGYDGAGKLANITDARGRVTLASIDTKGDLVTLRKPDLETYGFDYAEHRMTAKRSPKEDVTSYTFRADGTVATLTKPASAGSGGPATTTVDAALSHPPSYDASGAMKREGSYSDARGVAHAVEINRHGHIDKDSYVADGVARVERPVYVPDDFIRDEADTSHTRRRNTLLRVAYRTLNGIPLDHYKQLWDPHYRPTKELATPFSGSTGLTHEWLYAPDGWLRAERTGNAAYVRVFDRDAAGHVVLEYDSGATATSFPVSGESLEYVIRPDGQVASSTQRGTTTARTFTKTFSFDPATANESGWTDSVGRSMSFVRDAAGNVKETFDGTARSSATFDAMNRVVETKDALGNATTYRYDHPACGCSQDDLVTAIHTPDLPAGVDWVMTYDGQGRLSSVTDPHGFTESYEYTPTGELTKVKDKLLRDTTYSHDQLGRVLAMVDTLGRTHARSYALPTLTPAQQWTGPTLMAGSADGTAAATSLTAPLRSGDYQIGHNALPISGYPAEVELYRDATFQLALSRQFDLNRRMTLRADRVGEAFDSVRGASAATTGGFWQNQKSWNIFTSAPVLASDSALTSTGSESAAIAQNDFYEDVSANGYGGGTEGWARETMTRDAAGRVTELRRRLLASSAFGTVAADNVLSAYTYRPDGRLERLVNPDGTHDFTYDSRGLMRTQSVLGEGTYTYGYDEMGRNSFLEYPDGHTRAQVFDDLGRITSRCYEYSLGTTRCYTANYDAVGNPVRMTDPDGEDVFEYDALDRLKKVTRRVPAGGAVVSVEDYAYNALGALKVNAGVALDDQRPRLAGGGTADSAVPATLGGQPVTLDSGGFVTSLRGASFEYSRRGFLKRATPPVPERPEFYAYDSSLRRVLRQLGDTNGPPPAASDVEFYVHEGMDRVATIAPDGSLRDGYLFDGIDHPLRLKRPSTSATLYYELDLAGNVRALRASGGASVGGYRYSAFGKTVEDTATIDQPLRWKGRWYSPIAGGTYDVRARQWAPDAGVFLAIDEYEFHDASTTFWGWPHQNPPRFNDPFGRGICDLFPWLPGCAKPPKPTPPPGPPDGGPPQCPPNKCQSEYEKSLDLCYQTWGGPGSPRSKESEEAFQHCRARIQREKEECECKCEPEKCGRSCD